MTSVKQIIDQLVKLARDLPDETKYKYFRHEFRVLINTGQRFAWGVVPPKREELIEGKCNIPWSLTTRSRVRVQPCRVPCKGYFCHFHRDFAIINALPLNSKPAVDADTMMITDMAEEDTIMSDEDVEPAVPSEFDVDLCEYYGDEPCRNKATYMGFCSLHQLAVDQDNPEFGEIAVMELRIETIHLQMMPVTTATVSDNLDWLRSHVALKGREIQACHLYWLIAQRNLAARSAGLGRPSRYQNYQQSLDNVSMMIRDIYFTINNQVRVSAFP